MPTPSVLAPLGPFAAAFVLALSLLVAHRARRVSAARGLLIVALGTAIASVVPELWSFGALWARAAATGQLTNADAKQVAYLNLGWLVWLAFAAWLAAAVLTLRTWVDLGATAATFLVVVASLLAHEPLQAGLVDTWLAIANNTSSIVYVAQTTPVDEASFRAVGPETPAFPKAPDIPTQHLPMAGDAAAVTSRFGDLGCVADVSGPVRCYGRGLGGEGSEPLIWTVEGVSGVSYLASDTEYGCGLGKGRLFCWDLRADMARHHGMPTTLLAREISFETAVVDVAVGPDHACAVTAEGRVFCWGANAWGQLGHGTLEDRAEPTQVVGIDDAVQVTIRGAAGCAARRGGKVVCWGMSRRFAAPTVP